MKKNIPALLSFLALSLLVLGSCSKAADPAPEYAPTGRSASAIVAGRWELTRTTGGLAGIDQAADPSCKTELVFRAGGKVDFLSNGRVVQTLDYAERLDTAYLTGRQQLFLFGITFIAQVSASTLTLADDASDGFTYQYVRRPL